MIQPATTTFSLFNVNLTIHYANQPPFYQYLPRISMEIAEEEIFRKLSVPIIVGGTLGLTMLLGGNPYLYTAAACIAPVLIQLGLEKKGAKEYKKLQIAHINRLNDPQDKFDALKQYIDHVNPNSDLGKLLGQDWFHPNYSANHWPVFYGSMAGNLAWRITEVLPMSRGPELHLDFRIPCHLEDDNSISYIIPSYEYDQDDTISLRIEGNPNKTRLDLEFLTAFFRGNTVTFPGTDIQLRLPRKEDEQWTQVTRKDEWIPVPREEDEEWTLVT